MTEVVREYKTYDGLGAMLFKKIYAMSYAYRYKLLFEDVPFSWFLIHEADKIKDKESYQTTINQFNQLLYNPWAQIDFSKIPDLVLSKRIGQGLGTTEYGPGFISEIDFLMDAPVFNKVMNDNSNNIVIHLRRGNAIPENPRYTEDEFYLNLLSQIHILFDKFKLANPDVIICTDATDEPTVFKPDDSFTPQSHGWNQPFLHANAQGEYPVTSANFDEYRKVYPKLKVYNKLSTYDSMLLMLRAKVLIPAHSALSQSAGVLSHNRVIALSDKPGTFIHLKNKFKNKVGILDKDGNFIL